MLNSTKEDVVYDCDLGFYVKKHKGYLLRLTYNEGWKYCNIHENYTNANYKSVSKIKLSKVFSEYDYQKDIGHSSNLLCLEANKEFKCN